MSDQHLRVLLHEGGHGFHWGVLGGEIEDDEAVGTDAHLDRTRGDELRHIHAWAAGDDGHVETALGVFAVGYGFIESALLGLGSPVGGEADRRASGRGGGRSRAGGGQQGQGEDQAKLHGRDVRV